MPSEMLLWDFFYQIKQIRVYVVKFMFFVLLKDECSVSVCVEQMLSMHGSDLWSFADVKGIVLSKFWHIFTAMSFKPIFLYSKKGDHTTHIRALYEKQTKVLSITKWTSLLCPTRERKKIIMRLSKSFQKFFGKPFTFRSQKVSKTDYFALDCIEMLNVLFV